MKVEKNVIEIIYEDNDLIIVNKPAEILTIPDRLGEKPSVVGFLRQHFDKVMTVHRLDRETSGIICFAKHEAAHRHLSIQFEHKTVQKIYLALLDGNLHTEEGEIDKPIGEHPSVAGKMCVSRLGKPSLTLFRVRARFKHFTLVEANIKTGRTHQIRVHFQSIGYPLAIDALYGRRDGVLLSEVKQKGFRLAKFADEQPIMSRCTLHAFRLELQQPTTGEPLVFEAQPPKDFRALLTQLEKWGK